MWILPSKEKWKDERICHSCKCFFLHMCVLVSDNGMDISVQLIFTKIWPYLRHASVAEEYETLAS